MEKSKKNKKKKSILRLFFNTSIFILCVLILAMLISGFVVERVKVHNRSMMPTLEDGDGVLVEKISYRFSKPERFDIIVFRQNNSNQDLIKRVYGLPYETVRITDGKIYIDEEALEDIKGVDRPDPPGLAASSIKLSAGEYFVLGDNREESIDSRYEAVGIVPSTRIKGKMFMRILPFSKIKIF